MKQDNLNNLDISQPDPEWDYYELWDMAYQIKYKLDQAIKYMTAVEEADDSTDERLRQMFFSLSEMCEECSHEASGAKELMVDNLNEND